MDIIPRYLLQSEAEQIDFILVVIKKHGLDKFDKLEQSFLLLVLKRAEWTPLSKTQNVQLNKIESKAKEIESAASRAGDAKGASTPQSP